MQLSNTAKDELLELSRRYKEYIADINRLLNGRVPGPSPSKSVAAHILEFFLANPGVPYRPAEVTRYLWPTLCQPDINKYDFQCRIGSAMSALAKRGAIEKVGPGLYRMKEASNA